MIYFIGALGDNNAFLGGIMINIDKFKNIYCIGIGGIGLSAIAELLNHLNYSVFGSDIKKTPLTTHLESIGIDIKYEQIYENIKDFDLIVYTAAVHDDHPEIVAAKNQNIPCVSRAEMLGYLMAKYENSIAISGTHGKTTTTSMASLILREAAVDPTVLVGGMLDDIGGNILTGHSEYFVTEACEYVDSFLELSPKVEVLLNIDLDHLDYFKDINHITSSFEKFTHKLAPNGLVVLNNDDEHLRSLKKSITSTVLTFGHDKTSDYWADNIVFNDLGYPSFDVVFNGKVLTNIQLAVPGSHNIYNALAAIACTHYLGSSASAIKTALELYTGTHRRFDHIGTSSEGIKVFDDYAHHPTEIKATLSAAQNVPFDQLWCIFQPHTYTRTKSLFNEFSNAFNDCKHLIVTKIYAAREENIYNITAEDLLSSIKKQHPEIDAVYIDNFDDIIDYISLNAKSKDIVMTMGAGDISSIAPKILDKLNNK